MKSPILIQLDPDPQPSVFDAVVAIDSGAQHLLRHAGVKPDDVAALVHGGLFTRGLDDLKSTAIFIGGSDVRASESLLAAVKKTFFGPFRVSVLFDPGGCNTTAAAAILAALEGLTTLRGDARGATVSVLAATGPVGQRVARLLAGLDLGLKIRVGSRSLERAQAVVASLKPTNGQTVTAFSTGADVGLLPILQGADAIISAGAPAVTTLPAELVLFEGPKILIDLNAVPPAGIEGVEPGDKGKTRGANLAWGALGVGATKMKIHKRAIQQLFTSNDQVIDAEECLAIARAL